MTRDESKAVVFISALLVLAAGVRVGGGPEPWVAELPAVDAESLATAVRQADAADRRRKRPLAPGERIALNRAPAAEIDRLAGVGPALADRIVAYRDSVGGIRSADELRQVRGVGGGLLEKNRDRIDYAVPAGMRATPVRGAPAFASPSAPARVDLNRAGVRELEALPGIGPALAERIVAYRDSAGGFAAVDDLRKVKGVGPSLLQRLPPLLAAPP